MPTSPPQPWTLADAFETYGIRNWGAATSASTTRATSCVHPDGPEPPSLDLKELVDEVRRRGIGLPLLIRFTDVLRHRVVHLNEAFRKAIAEHGYKGQYRGVYPIKVNQHRYVVGDHRRDGQAVRLRPGGRQQARAARGDGAARDHEDALIICNGYKDEEYIETALFASQAGPQGHPGGREAQRAAAHRRGGAPHRHRARASACA